MQGMISVLGDVVTASSMFLELLNVLQQVALQELLVIQVPVSRVERCPRDLRLLTAALWDLFPNSCLAAVFAFLDMVVHNSGHMDSSLDLCWTFVSPSIYHMWPLVDCLVNLESCESDPVFRVKSTTFQ